MIDILRVSNVEGDYMEEVLSDTLKTENLKKKISEHIPNHMKTAQVLPFAKKPHIHELPSIWAFQLH